MRDPTFAGIAELIERCLDGKEGYPREWNDLVEVPLQDQSIDGYRKRCHELDLLVNRPGDPDADAVSELRALIGVLRERTS